MSLTCVLTPSCLADHRAHTVVLHNPLCTADPLQRRARACYVRRLRVLGEADEGDVLVPQQLAHAHKVNVRRHEEHCLRAAAARPSRLADGAL